MALPDIESFAYGKEYSDFSGNIDLNDVRGKAASELVIVDPGSGSIVLVFVDGNTETFTELTAGERLPFKVKTITGTGTDVAKVRACWT